MIPRDVQSVIQGFLEGFPVVTIMGPRQSGKTTLAKAVFGHKPYLSLEDPDVRRMALDDPRASWTASRTVAYLTRCNAHQSFFPIFKPGSTLMAEWGFFY